MTREVTGTVEEPTTDVLFLGHINIYGYTHRLRAALILGQKSLFWEWATVKSEIQNSLGC